MNPFKRKNFEAVREFSKVSGLAKTLTGTDLIMLGLGGIVGTGVFALTGLVAASYSGPAVTLSYAIAGFVCIFVALVYTELATMLPTSGSIYTYTFVAFGEVFAWLIGGLLIIELGFSTAAVAGSWSSYVQSILSSGGITLPKMLSCSPFEGGIINLPAALIVLFVGSLLYRGTKESKKLNNVLVIVKIGAIFTFIAFAAPNFDSSNWEVLMPFGFNDVIRGASILFFSFTGFASLASTAEECKNPKRDLTIGIIGSLLIVTLIYVLTSGALVSIAPYNELNNAQSLAYALQSNGSNVGSALVAVGAVSGMTTVIMMNTYAISRIFYAIARDGLISQHAAKIHAKYETPYITILFFTLMSSIIGSLVPYDFLAKLASMSALNDYIVVAIIVMLFRFRFANEERPFKCPLVFITAPFALLSCIYLLTQLIFSDNGELLLTGKVYLAWFVFMFAIYLVLYYTKRKQE